MKRTGLRRKPRSDKVTPEVYVAVMRRDVSCIAPLLDPSASGRCSGRSTLDHIQDQYGRMGKRAASDEAHLVVLCSWHHLYGWATRNRPTIRKYLARFYPDVHRDPYQGLEGSDGAA